MLPLSKQYWIYSDPTQVGTETAQISLNYKTKRNTKQTPWNMVKHDQTDKIRDCA